MSGQFYGSVSLMLMSYALLILYVFIGRITVWSMAVTVAMVAGRGRNISTMIVISVIAGLIEDIVRVHPLGLTSALLVALSCSVWLIESQYRARFVWWWFIVGIIGELIFRLVMQLPFSFTAILGQLVTLGIIQWLLSRLTETEGIYVGR